VTYLPRAAHRREGVGAAGEQLPAADQQHADVVLTLFLLDHRKQEVKVTDVHTWTPPSWRGRDWSVNTSFWLKAL